MNRTNLIFTIVFALAVGLGMRSLFPIHSDAIVIQRPGRIVYDTVKSIDTIRIAVLRKTTDTLWLDRVTVTQPETVYVLPPLVGLKALSVPKAYGDTMTAFGFELRPDTGASYITRDWSATWIYPGPLRAIVADTFPPRASFWPAPSPRRDCGILCKLSHYAVGGAGGYALCRLGA